MTCPVCRAAAEMFLERSAQHRDVDPDSSAGQYLLGLSDAYADAAALLEQLAHPGWPAQTGTHPYDLPIGETA